MSLLPRRDPSSSLRPWVSVLRHRGRGLTAAVFIAPMLIFISVFSYYPAVRALIGAFTAWDGFNAPSFVGFRNFIELVHDPVFIASLWHVLIWVMVAIPLALFPAFAVAELIFHLKRRRQQYWYRTLFIVPMVLPGVVPILIWEFGFYSPGGIIDRVLHSSREWLLAPHWALAAMILMGFPWVGAFNLLILYAGLQNIPADILDAAAVDGISPFGRIWRIDAPLVTAQWKLLAVLAVLGSAQNLLTPLLLTGGGPLDATMTPVLYMYQSAFTSDRYGYAMAISVLLFVAIMALVIINLRFIQSSPD